MLDRRPDDALLRQLAWILGLAAISSALLVSVSSALLVRRGLAPLHSWSSKHASWESRTSPATGKSASTTPISPRNCAR